MNLREEWGRSGRGLRPRRVFQTRHHSFPLSSREMRGSSCKVPARFHPDAGRGSRRSQRLSCTLQEAAPPPSTRHAAPPQATSSRRVEKDSHFVLAGILSVPCRIFALLRRNILPGARWHCSHSRPRSRSGYDFAVPPPRRLAHSALRKTLASKGRAVPSQGKARQTEFVMPCTPCCGQFLSAAERLAAVARLCSAGRSTALDGRRRQACWDRLCRASLNGMQAHLRSPWDRTSLGWLRSVWPPLNAPATPGRLNGSRGGRPQSPAFLRHLLWHQS